MSSKSEKPSLFKQLLGAFVGGTLALSLYYTYKIGVPQVEALLVIPQSGIESRTDDSVRISHRKLDPDKQKRIMRRAEEIAQQFSGPSIQKVARKRSGTEVEGGPRPVVGEPWEANVGAQSPHVPMNEVLEQSPADDLTDTGLGLWLVTLIAFAVPSALLWRRKAQV